MAPQGWLTKERNPRLADFITDTTQIMRERINKLVDKAYSIHEELEKLERELRQHLIDKGKLPEGQALCHLAQLGLSACRDRLRELRELVDATR